jgi:hypothetical protein
LIVVPDRKTKEILVDLSRKLGPAWEDFVNADEVVQGLEIVKGGEKLNKTCKQVSEGIDCLIENMRTAVISGESHRLID